MKKKYLLVSLLGLIATGGLVVGTASANGWFVGRGYASPEELVKNQTQMFQSQADLLGINIDKVKQYWAEGKSMQDILTELGITQEQWQAKMKQSRLDQTKANLQILVQNGVITQEQADLRLKTVQNNAGSIKGKGKMKHMLGGCGL